MLFYQTYILPISCSDAEISGTSATVMLHFWWAHSGVDVNAAHAVLSDNGTLVANTLSSCNLSCFAVCVSWVFSS